MREKDKFIGIDLGGTNIKAGVVARDGRILGEAQAKTNAARTPDEVIADIAATAKNALKASGVKIGEVESIGVGSPGAIDDKTGAVIFAGNLNWEKVPLKAKLEQALGIPAFVSNDANVAAYAEYLFGAGRGKKSLYLITLGTGVGGGYVLDGKIQSGFHGVGMEIGHMILVPEGRLCTCGNRGCLETLRFGHRPYKHGQRGDGEKPERSDCQKSGGQP